MSNIYDPSYDLRKQLEAVKAERDRLLMITSQIQSIMATYREQQKSPFGVDSPGGLQHMGDVWNLFAKWETALAASPDQPAEPRCPRCGHKAIVFGEYGTCPNEECDMDMAFRIVVTYPIKAAKAL